MKKGNMSLLLAFLLFLGLVCMMFTTVLSNTHSEINMNKTISRKILTRNDERDLFKALLCKNLDHKLVLVGSDALVQEDLLYIKQNLDSTFNKSFTVTANKQVVDELRDKGLVVRFEDSERCITYSVKGFEMQGFLKETGETNPDGSAKTEAYYVVYSDDCTFNVEEELLRNG